MNSIHMRPYTESDYEMLSQWRVAHGKDIVPEIVLPKCGVICEINGNPTASLFLHMSNSNGMCMVEHAVSAPGLTIKLAREAFGHCMSCLKKIAADLGYHTMAAYAHPAMVRLVKRHGFRAGEKNLVQMFAPTQEVSNG